MATLCALDIVPRAKADYDLQRMLSKDDGPDPELRAHLGMSLRKRIDDPGARFSRAYAVKESLNKTGLGAFVAALSEFADIVSPLPPRPVAYLLW